MQCTWSEEHLWPCQKRQIALSNRSHWYIIPTCWCLGQWSVLYAGVFLLKMLSYMNKLSDLAKQTKFEGRSLSSCCGWVFKETGQNRNAQVFISYKISSCPDWFSCLFYVANVTIGCSKCSRFQWQENWFQHLLYSMGKYIVTIIIIMTRKGKYMVREDIEKAPTHDHPCNLTRCVYSELVFFNLYQFFIHFYHLQPSPSNVTIFFLDLCKSVFRPLINC